MKKKKNERQGRMRRLIKKGRRKIEKKIRGEGGGEKEIN